MKFKVINFGCKVNAYESTFIEEKFLSEGKIEASSIDDADIIVINTCSVTNTADQKCKKFIRRIKRENPNAIIIACGCSVQNNFDEYDSYGIDILLGTYNKSQIPNLLEKYNKDKNKIRIFDNNRKKEFDNMLLNKFIKHTRAFIKIQDGCDNFCSYCVIPLVRGSVRSKDFNLVINEAKELANNGHKEIVLVGIHTGSYLDNGKDLVDLINEISKIDEIKRIRISSIEITELDDKFINMLKENKKVVNHLHIPLQAGSDEILKIMNRKYDLKFFFNKIAEIRSVRPDINITTDVIVGHPYETDELFEKTIETCQKLEFGKIHVFPYSKRNNTKAANMDNQVDEATKKDRASKLIRVSEILEEKYEYKFIGKRLSIITEINHQNEVVGFTENYIKVLLSDDKLEANKLINVELLKRENNVVYAKCIKEGE